MSAKERLSTAFRRAYEAAGLSQEAVSDALGIRQATISKYARGDVQPPLDFLEQFELSVLRQPRGHVLRLAGYVADDVDLVAAIKTDPHLTEDGREVVLHTYDFCRRQAAVSGADGGQDMPEPETRGELLAQLSARFSPHLAEVLDGLEDRDIAPYLKGGNRVDQAAGLAKDTIAKRRKGAI